MLKDVLDRTPHLQRHLFEKGFLITDRALSCEAAYPFYGNWDRTRVGNYDFWIYSGVARFFWETEQGTFFLIGHAYDPFAMEHEEAKLLKAIAEAWGTPRYYELIDQLTGIFLLGVVSGGRIACVTDASGMQYACYGTVGGRVYLSSHMRLIGDLCGLQTDAFVERLIRYRWYRYMMGNYLPGDMTCFSELKRLVPNTALAFEEGAFRITRFYPNRELPRCRTQEDYDRVIAEAARVLQNTMALIPQKWERPAISLTGGIDSNTTFAAASGVYGRYTAFSYVAMEREAVDAQKAREIGERFGVPHTTYEVPGDNESIPDFAVYKQIFEYNGGGIGRQKDNDVRKKVTLIRQDFGDVEVKSWISETIRAYAYKYFGRKRFPKSLSRRNYTSLYKLFFMNRKLVWETDRQFGEYLKKTDLKAHLYNYDESDFFVWEMMHGGKCGLNIGVMKSYADITIPYNNRRLLDLLLQVPLDKRIADQHHLDLKRAMNPALYEMGIRVVNRNQPPIRGKLLNVYYTLHSWLPF